MPYVLSHGKSPHGTDWIHEAAIECYLPLLHSLDRLLEQGIKPRWTVNMTPILAEQLEDPSYKESLVEYAHEKIAAAKVDAENFKQEGPMWMEGLSHFWIAQYEKPTRAIIPPTSFKFFILTKYMAKPSWARKSCQWNWISKTASHFVGGANPPTLDKGWPV